MNIAKTGLLLLGGLTVVNVTANIGLKAAQKVPGMVGSTTGAAILVLSATRFVLTPAPINYKRITSEVTTS